MRQTRNYVKIVAGVVALLIAAQVGVFLVARSHRMHGYLIAQLERAFGRPVEVSHFSAQILPVPEVDADEITIGEDPAFGHEYFLRAEHMTASLRWIGLLRGHFEFGTMSLTRPSLILVRNAQGRWNLEDWLPPVNARPGNAGIPYGPQQLAETTNHLQKIEFDEGRVNFKYGEEKRPFAFTGVSGSVEQVSQGRWQLRMEAQPWRSGVTLQSTGILQVRGDVAGTSARLQPAQLQLHWGKVSIADLFRLATGNDPGVRGEFALDGNASVGKGNSSDSAAGPWQFDLHARAIQIHRWDLTERTDNPRVNLNLKGSWNLVAGTGRAEEMTIELPGSRLQGSAELQIAEPLTWGARIERAGVQASDVLAWYRAFQPAVAEEVAMDDYFAGETTLHGWPLQWEETRIASAGGSLKLPGFPSPIRIGEVRGGMRGEKFNVEPVRLTLGPPAKEAASASKTEKPATKAKTAMGTANVADLRLVQDFGTGHGDLRIEGRLEEVQNVFKATGALGHTLNHGWELSGGAGAAMDLSWERGFQAREWNGTVDLKKAQLQVAGLNQPLNLDEVSVEWKDGQRAATIARAGAFGATWWGGIQEAAAKNALGGSDWGFHLHADRLDATELDRWFGPRARPNWLQRLLTSLLEKNNTGAKPSELLRRISAEGQLTADRVTIEKVRLEKVKANLAFHDLHLEVSGAEAQWAGGVVQGGMKAVFSTSPSYTVAVAFDGVNLALLPWAERWIERWAGTAKGMLQLTTKGVGREELLSGLQGNGELKLKGVEFRGWDVSASLEAGAPRLGQSRWKSGAGEFEVKDRALRFDGIRLEGLKGQMDFAGTLGFGQEAKITISQIDLREHKTKGSPVARSFQMSGTADALRIRIEPAAVAQAKP
jgi:AsmA family/AsmA-like C-terminal region